MAERSLQVVPEPMSINEDAKPLLAKEPQPETATGCRGTISRLFLTERNPVFATDMELAVRASIFIVATGLPFIIPRGHIDWLDWMMDKGIYSNGVVIFFVYNINKTFGETLSNCTFGIRGAFFAVCNTWLLYYIFPGGVREDSPPYVFWGGIAYGGLFIFAMLFFNFSISAAIFAIANFVFWWMAFLKPGDDNFDGPGTGKFDALTDTGVHCLITTWVGCFLCVLATLLPYPIFAIGSAKDTAGDLVRQLPCLWRLFADYYGAERPNVYIQDQVRRRLARLQKKSDTLSGHISMAWWECFGMGTTQKVRRMLTLLDKTVVRSYDRVFSLWSSCGTEEFNENHTKMMRKIKPDLLAIVLECEVLLNRCFDATVSGTLTSENELAIKKQIEVVYKAEENLTTNFVAGRKELKRSASTANTSDDETGLFKDLQINHAFAYNLFGFSRLVCEFAVGLVAFNQNPESLPQAYASGGLSVIVEGVLDKDNVQFTLRSCFAIFSGFAVGYIGYEDMVAGYNASIACTVSVLLSRFTGSAMIKNLGRIQGVVLGMVAGQIIHSLFEMCEWWNVTLLTLSIFFYGVVTLFIYFNSTQYAYIGCLLAANGCQQMLMGHCEAADSEVETDKAGSYSSIVTTVVAIALIMLYDQIFSPGRASDAAHRSLLEAWDQFTESVKQHFDKSYPAVKFERDALWDTLNKAESMGAEAFQEPRYWRTEWRNGVFDLVIGHTKNLCYDILGMQVCMAEGFANGGKKNDVLMAILGTQSFPKVTALLLEKFSAVRKLLAFFVHETVDRFEGFSDEDATREFRYEEQKFVSDFVKEIRSHPVLQGTEVPPTLEKDPLCQVCMAHAAIEAIFQDLRKIQHDVMRAA